LNVWPSSAIADICNILVADNESVSISEYIKNGLSELAIAIEK
jgi:hypothetical protein